MQRLRELSGIKSQKKTVAKAELLKATRERISLRGLSRVFGVSRKTITQWFKTALQGLPRFADSLDPAQEDDVLELDELWSFVGNKKRQVWLWIALCRRTRQVVAYTLGDRSTQTCQQLYNNLPEGSKHGKSSIVFWDIYRKSFLKPTIKSLGKEEEETILGNA